MRSSNTAVLAARQIPRVLAFGPAAPIIPANILRCYVHFDRPGRGLIIQSDIHLEENNGAALPDPFVDFGQELWSPDGRRLTLLLDPGRVKRNVKGFGDLASILQPGFHYRWRCHDTVWRFGAGEAQRTPLAPELWKLHAPASPLAPVCIAFDRVMDSALLVSQISLITADHGEPVAGKAHVTNEGRCWSFAPLQPWLSCDHRVQIGNTIEDVCGNRLSKALDHDRKVPPGRQPKQRGCLSFRMEGPSTSGGVAPAQS